MYCSVDLSTLSSIYLPVYQPVNLHYMHTISKLANILSSRQNWREGNAAQRKYVPIWAGKVDSRRSLLLSLNLFNSVSYFTVGTEMSYRENDQNDKYITGERVSQTSAGKCSLTALTISSPKGCQGRRWNGIRSLLGSLPMIRYRGSAMRKWITRADKRKEK